MVQLNATEQLVLPAELQDVPENVLKVRGEACSHLLCRSALIAVLPSAQSFLARFTQWVAASVSPGSSSAATGVLFDSVFARLSSPEPPGLRLAFQHVCRQAVRQLALA
jgi:hypothetical protein